MLQLNDDYHEDLTPEKVDRAAGRPGVSGAMEKILTRNVHKENSQPRSTSTRPRRLPGRCEGAGDEPRRT